VAVAETTTKIGIKETNPKKGQSRLDLEGPEAVLLDPKTNPNRQSS
jgi:hypothetical protein